MLFDNIVMTRESKYYAAGGVRACPEPCRRVAVRHNASTAVSYLLSDHPSTSLRTSLGSTAVTANSSGVYATELRYYAYGGVRYNPGNQVTTDPSLHSGHTGQRWDSGTSLYYYGARWYDASLARFIQADTVVPQPGNPGSLNRYSYVLNNPVRYTAPPDYRLVYNRPRKLNHEPGWMADNTATTWKLEPISPRY